MTEEHLTEQIRKGLGVPLVKRQARWDRIRAWKTRFSLAEMVELEEQETSIRLTRERIRTIANGPRPGSVGRPRLPGLRARERSLASRRGKWAARDTPFAKGKVSSIDRELRSVRSAIRTEERVAG